MNHFHRIATAIRVTVRWSLACATFWLAANVGWLLVMRGDAGSVDLAKMCGVLAVLASAAWQWLFSMEQRHEMILLKHRARVPAAPVRRKPAQPAIRPSVVRPAMAEMMAQAV